MLRETFRSAIRTPLTPILEHNFPSIDLSPTRAGLSRAEQLSQEGYGLVMLINHFSKRDPVQIISEVIFKNPKFRGKKIVAPIARHQFEALDEKYKVLAGLLGITLCPIVTQDTVDRGMARPGELGTGFMPYLDISSEVLVKKGIVLIAPQQKRVPQWLPYQGEPVRALMLNNERKNRQRIKKGEDPVKLAFHLVGVGIPGQLSYQEAEVGELNKGTVYKLMNGPTFTDEELREISEVVKPDQFIYGQFFPYLPDNYLPLEILFPSPVI